MRALDGGTGDEQIAGPKLQPSRLAADRKRKLEVREESDECPPHLEVEVVEVDDNNRHNEEQQVNLSTF